MHRRRCPVPPWAGRAAAGSTSQINACQHPTSEGGSKGTGLGPLAPSHPLQEATGAPSIYFNFVTAVAVQSRPQLRDRDRGTWLSAGGARPRRGRGYEPRLQHHCKTRRGSPPPTWTRSLETPAWFTAHRQRRGAPHARSFALRVGSANTPQKQPLVPGGPTPRCLARLGLASSFGRFSPLLPGCWTSPKRCCRCSLGCCGEEAVGGRGAGLTGEGVSNGERGV